MLAPALSACDRHLACSDKDVQATLGQVLDKVYAESRTLATIDLTVLDIITVSEAENRASCKAIVKLDITYLGQKRTEEPTIPFTAEITDKGDIYVTAQP